MQQHAATTLIFACVTGSRLYGTHRPDSDYDIRGVCAQTPESLIGLSGFEQYQPSGETARDFGLDMWNIDSDDITIYGVAKFIQLALNSNPNIIELLFVPSSHRLHSSTTWDEIVEQRFDIISTKAIHTFAGYAYSQLDRIKKHYQWLHDPPNKPDPKDFGMFESEQGGAHWEDATMHKAYENHLAEYQHYLTWRKERNPARAELEQAYGYDTKHASHLYRLSLEGEELIKDGFLTLPLKPLVRDEVLAVLHGAVPYEEVVNKGEGMRDYLMGLEAASPLRKKPAFNAVEDLLMRINYTETIIPWLLEVLR